MWRCDGFCQNQAPYFGIVRRSMNRPPGPNDFWWNEHMRMCRGHFVKIMGPEVPEKRKKAGTEKSVTDLSKYINKNPYNTLLSNGFTKTYLGNTFAALQTSSIGRPKPSSVQGKAVFDSIPKVNGSIIRQQPNHNIADTVRDVWLKKHQVIANASTATTDTKAVEDVARKVREVWANKTCGVKNNETEPKAAKSNKRTPTSPERAPPVKVKKIDDFFKKRVGILKDIYGSDLVLQKRGDRISTKTVLNDDQANGIFENSFVLESDVGPDQNVPVIEIPDPERETVECPICQWPITREDINSHLDECLNSEEINKLVTNGGFIIEPSTSTADDSQPLDLSVNTDPTLNPTNVEPEVLDSTNTDPVIEINTQICPCCLLLTDKPIAEHFEECVAFEPNPSTITVEDDMFDDSATMNDTGTKFPCPVCMTMIEEAVMNIHLDLCIAQQEEEAEPEEKK